MTEEEEKQRWAQALDELQKVMSIAKIAEHLGVDDRMVWRWKAGDGRPLGMNAVRLYVLHVKSCPSSQCLACHIQVTGNIAM